MGYWLSGSSGRFALQRYTAAYVPYVKLATSELLSQPEKAALEHLHVHTFSPWTKHHPHPNSNVA